MDACRRWKRLALPILRITVRRHTGAAAADRASAASAGRPPAGYLKSVFGGCAPAGPALKWL
jgi:hypothetical protein